MKTGYPQVIKNDLLEIIDTNGSIVAVITQNQDSLK